MTDPTPDHPLTETDAAELWDAHRESDAVPFHAQGRLYVRGQTAMLRATFDKGREYERDEDARLWVPLGEDDPLNAGDEVRQDWYGTTTTAIVGRVDGDGDPWTDEGAPIGSLDSGTWHVRRAAEDLPTEDGAVIIPAEGHEYIATNEGMAHALVHLGGKWYGGASRIDPEQITPGTWQVAPNA